MSQDPSTGKPGSPEPTMEKPEGSNAGSPEALAPVPSTDKPGFEGDGGYIYDVDDKTKAIKILKSPRSAGGQSITPGSPAYAAIAKELNDKYQLGLDVPSVKPRTPLTFSAEADMLRDMNPRQRAEYEATGRLDSAKADRVAEDTLVNNAALAGVAQRTQASLASQKPKDTGLTSVVGGKPPPLAPPLAASMKRLGFPGDASQGITPELVQWLASLPDASLYNPSASAGNALEMIKAIAASSTGVNAKDYGKPNGQPIM